MKTTADGVRTPEQIREHYEVECELADRLRKSTRQERLTLYTQVYDELIARVPHHPRLLARDSAKERERGVRNQLELVRPFLSSDAVFMDVGSGDCMLSMAVAAVAKQVYAVDVSVAASANTSAATNLEHVLTDGINIPLEPNSVDVAFSYSLMEHLHPDDASDQLRSIYQTIKPSGVYICVTPNRLNGPHDVSKYFDDVPKGFHLKEYSVGDLRKLFAQAGFSKTYVRLFAGSKSWPAWGFGFRLLEASLGLLPGRLRRSVGSKKPWRVLFQTMVVAQK